jgi:hypothetical protein
VTAREAYNLIRAAADRKTGDPRQFYNYVIPPYEADGRSGVTGIADQAKVN